MNPFENAGSSDWFSLLHAGTGTGGTNSGYGSKIPSIMFRPSDGKLIFYSAVNGNAMYSYETGSSYSTGQWVSIEVSQLQNNLGDYTYSITINGVVVHTVVNTQPQQFSNVKIYSGNDVDEPAPCWIRDVQYTTMASRSGKYLFREVYHEYHSYF